MAAHSYVRIDRQYLFAVREGYLEEFAALFRDDDLVTDLARPVYATTVRRMRERLDVIGLPTMEAERRIRNEYAEVSAVEPGAESMPEWLLRATEAFSDGDVIGDDVPGWTGMEPTATMRLILDAVDPDATVALDLEEVVSRGYVSATPDLCERAFNKHFTASTGPMIVLTEGPSDSEALEAALHLLAPHLRGYIRFLDWNFKPEGSASALIRAVRAFAAAGVSNPVLALFDNDTAAAEALTTLNFAALPPNFRVLQLPILDLAVPGREVHDSRLIGGLPPSAVWRRSVL